jgi:hypothetical protein
MLIKDLLTLGSGLEVAFIALVLLSLRKRMRGMGTAAEVAQPVQPVSIGPQPDDSVRTTVRHLEQAVWLDYDGMDGIEFERLVVIHQLSGVLTANGVRVDKFEAFCRTYRIPRTFLVSQVVRAFDVDTGEMIVDFPIWLEHLAEAEERAARSR